MPTTKHQPPKPVFVTFLAAGLFSISIAILIFASTAQTRPAAWIGITDVIVAVVLVLLNFYIKTTSTPTRDALFRPSYHVVLYLPTIMLLTMWVTREHLNWNVLLPGLAWRTWIFLYTLPSFLGRWVTSHNTTG